ncbi:Zn-dependent Hydrolase, including glyoxylases [Hahella chejuensis KCTC 2396]|uniref:Zn-dependent Hydrolase, including glyoxylases n=1 Tax=Hahella chejuensis (strain KCTC 2396) TaxID=349521 RepID=Q2SEP1_HAHCH|nr:MBL fold metallo-hydrolase [Hahella chejuensis]ABC30883.1 Zn-dependent Hydrolase, including glyoxylases [Hahella chejuensis KCTC 2396]
MNLIVRPFFDRATYTLSYVTHAEGDSRCAIIDPVLDYDSAAGRVSTDSAQNIVRYVKESGLQVEWILETHAHADHLSAAQWLKRELGGKVAIGEHIREVQSAFGRIFDLGTEFAVDGSQFDHLFRDGETFHIGTTPAQVMYTPGHTPACVSYVVADAVFIGDTLFMPDYGAARADFPGGDATELYRSIRRILSLPPQTRFFVCHDYLPNGRELRYESTVAEQRRENVLCHDGVSEQGFVQQRKDRDAKLGAPALMLPSLQVNIRGGKLPEAADNGVRYLKIPLNQIS